MKLSPLLLLHGALGAASQFDTLTEKLKDHFDVHTLDFSGHGKNTYDGNLTMEILANDILHYMDLYELERCDIFGYSMGGYAAVMMAMEHPDRVHRIMTLGTKWHWDAETATREVKMLDAEKMLEKIPAFAEILRLRHTGQGWKAVLHRTAGLMTHLGYTGGLTENDFSRVHIPVLICLGSDDRMVTREESEASAGWIPQGTFRLLEGVPHPLEKVDMNILAEEIINAFTTF
ncbi:MAG: alpha/beta hydrolase [Saprospiraceae bacterium]|nr:alpha/beta hydrolase [Saprospiraceae bacterium]